MNFCELDDLFDKLPEMGIFAGDIIVTRDNEIVHRKTVGYSDYENTVPLNDKNLFWCFSATKVITCAMALRLVEEGRLDLDAPVSDYLPEYADIFVRRVDGTISKAENVMKVRHLFSMSSGLDYNFRTGSVSKFLKENPHASTREVVKQFVKVPLNFEPGTNFL